MANKAGIAVISFTVSATACCASTQRAGVAKALIRGTARSSSRLPRNVLPSQQTCSPDRQGKAACTHRGKASVKAGGWMHPITSRRVSCEGIPGASTRAFHPDPILDAA